MSAKHSINSATAKCCDVLQHHDDSPPPLYLQPRTRSSANAAMRCEGLDNVVTGVHTAYVPLEQHRFENRGKQAALLEEARRQPAKLSGDLKSCCKGG